MTRSSAKLFTTLIATAVSGIAAADSVSGQFDLGGKVLKPTEVAAFRVRDQFNAREFETYVMLTVKPVDRDAISKSSDPYTTAINDDAVSDADYLAFHVDGKKEVGVNAHFGGVQYVDSSGKIMGQAGSLVADCKTNTAERIACSVKTAKPVQSMDGPAWSLDVQFDAEVLARAAGKPLPKDGGEPGKAFKAFVVAANGDDFPKLLALLVPSEAADFNRDYATPEENLASAKQMFGFSVPKQPKITGGELVDENTAILEVEGVPYDGSRFLYLVTMERHDGRWGYHMTQQAGMLK